LLWSTFNNRVDTGFVNVTRYGNIISDVLPDTGLLRITDFRGTAQVGQLTRSFRGRTGTTHSSVFSTNGVITENGVVTATDNTIIHK